MNPAPGTSLPERLRSRARVEEYQYRDQLTAGLMTEAADELDRRAEEVLRLRTGINAMRLRGEMALKGEEQPPLDPETPGYEVITTPKWDAVRRYDPDTLKKSDRPRSEIRVVADPLCPPGWLIAVHPDGTLTVRRR